MRYLTTSACMPLLLCACVIVSPSLSAAPPGSLPQKLLALEMAFRTRPKLREGVAVVQIGMLADSTLYSHFLCSRINVLVGRINAEFGKVST